MIQGIYHILTVEEMESRVDPKIREQLHLEEETDDSLDILELVEIRFSINGKTCKVFHSFPGDNPYGIFISEKETFEFGEGDHKSPDMKTEEAKVFLKWYYEITENLMHFGKFQSLYMKLED